MSHFTVLVIGDVEGQMEKYDENLEVAPYVKYTRESAAVEYANKVAEFEAIVKGNNTDKYNIPYCIKYLDELREMGPTKYFEERSADYEEHDENGNPLSTYNPNSKWDWYSEGGRWGGFFILKNGTKVDKAKKGDIDFLAMTKARVDDAVKQWDTAEKECNGDTNRDKADRYWKYGIEEEDWKAGKAAFIEKAAKGAICTFAVVKDGEWYERGEMGWFASVSNEKEHQHWVDEFESLMKTVDDDMVLTLVDCHI